GIGAAEESDQLVRAVAADDPLRLKVETPGDAGAQALRPAVGIAMEIGDGVAESGHGLGTGPEGILVGGELGRPVDAGERCLAADMGGDLRDARTQRHRHESIPYNAPWGGGPSWAGLSGTA